MSLQLEAPSTEGALASPSLAATGPEAAGHDREAAFSGSEAAADDPKADAPAVVSDQPFRTALEAMDAIQLHDPNAEKQLQQLLEGSRAAEQEADAAMENDVEVEEPSVRRQGSSPVSPAGSRAMLKSQLWEQQVCNFMLVLYACKYANKCMLEQCMSTCSLFSNSWLNVPSLVCCGPYSIFWKIRVAV